MAVSGVFTEGILLTPAIPAVGYMGGLYSLGWDATYSPTETMRVLTHLHD